MTMTFLNFVSGHTFYLFVWIVGMTTAALTAFYMTRVYFLTFRGTERFRLPKAGSHGDDHDDHGHGIHAPHESNGFMTFPLWVLAILAVVGGYLGLPGGLLHKPEAHLLNGWLGGHHGHGGPVDMSIMHHIEKSATLGLEVFLILFSIAIAIGGVYVAWNLYSKKGLQGDAVVQKRFGKFYKHMENKFYVDELYQKTIIDPFVFVGRNVIMAFDKWVIDGFVNGLGNVVLFVGDTLKMLQTGLVGQYAMMLVVGVMVILSYLLFF